MIFHRIKSDQKERKTLKSALKLLLLMGRNCLELSGVYRKVGGSSPRKTVKIVLKISVIC